MILLLLFFCNLKGKFANKNSCDQKNDRKNGFDPPNMVIFSPNFTCYVHFFMVFNTWLHKNSPIFWIFQKNIEFCILLKKANAN